MHATTESQRETHRMLERQVGCRARVALVLLLVAAPAAANHDKTDVVTTDDGATYVGEIKSVTDATLNLKTDPAGLLSIAWRHVTGLTSKYQYRIELSGGVRRFGTLGPPRKPGYLRIVGPSGTVEVDLVDVYKIVPLEQSFWKSLDGSIDFGLSYTQANDFLQYNLSGDAGYRSRRGFASVSGQSLLNTQEDAPTTSQHYLKLLLAQLLGRNWGTFELGQLESNPAQGYDARLILGAGGAYYLIESSREMLNLDAGVVYNGEIVTGSSEKDHSAEALLGMSYKHFKRGAHSPSVQLSLLTFTTISGGSRFRAVFSFNVSWKVIGDFTFSVQLNERYDTDPPGTDSNKNDLSLVTSVGYTF